MANNKPTEENNRIFRFDFSGDEPKLISKGDVGRKPTPKKTLTKQHREAIKAGQQKQHERFNGVLSPLEKRFCQEYVKTCNGAQSVLSAGYNVANNQTASVYANGLLKMPKIQKEIHRITSEQEAQGIADAKEVMQFFTDVMRGKVKDQFGLEASLAERAKAAQEIAKRTVDIDNKIKANQAGDNVLNIKIDWQQN